MKRLSLLLASLLLVLSGCSAVDLSTVPLPGGEPGGEPSYVVTIEFADVLDLVPQAAVKVNDVTVGSVEKIWLDGWTAKVRVRVADSVHLPATATAAIRQSSLLGEKFVELIAPAGQSAQASLADGAVIGLDRTSHSAEVEELLGALGMVLSGGGLDQLRVITSELSTALEGHEEQARDALSQLDGFIGGLAAQTEEIAHAIDALDRLTSSLAAQRQTIGDAIDAFAPGLTVLAEQRQQLTAALTALGDLGDVGRRVIESSRDDTLASVAALRPILAQLVQAGDALPQAIDFLLTFPFPPNADQDVVGDAMNLWITIDADATDILANLLAAAPPGQSPPTPTVPSLPLPLPSLPVPSLPSLPLPSLSLPSLPIPLPSLPPLPFGAPLAQTLTGKEIVRGQVPHGAADGLRGPLLTLLDGGLAS